MYPNFVFIVFSTEKFKQYKGLFFKKKLSCVFVRVVKSGSELAGHFNDNFFKMDKNVVTSHTVISNGVVLPFPMRGLGD